MGGAVNEKNLYIQMKNEYEEVQSKSMIGPQNQPPIGPEPVWFR